MVIDGIIIKGRHIVIPQILKTQVLDHLHVNHMGIEITKRLAWKLVYWIKINVILKTMLKLIYMPYM